IEAHPNWLTEARLPAYAPELNAVDMGLPQCGFCRLLAHDYRAPCPRGFQPRLSQVNRVEVGIPISRVRVASHHWPGPRLPWPVRGSWYRPAVGNGGRRLRARRSGFRFPTETLRASLHPFGCGGVSGDGPLLEPQGV